ncbi:hypothetical protein KWI_0103940 [Xanthomonas vasicola pv. vasculorum NCPPB 206]|nr:hypothetical protein KWI_0103940 [Xanthomonas vasicola pv. vasculorum NCPPB 206]
MITTGEFHVATASSCTPLSLLLPRSHLDEPLLIGTSQSGKSACLMLSGHHQFSWFESEGADRWFGLAYPLVRIEMDETSVFSPDYRQAALGNLIRKGTSLAICAKSREFRGQDFVIVEDNLPSTGEISVGFTRWQVALGHGPEKKVLLKIGQSADDELLKAP